MEPDESEEARRPAGLAFVLVTLFIDILGIGIVIPVLPELVKEFVGGSTTLAGWYVGIIGAITPRLPNISSPRNVVVDADVAGAVEHPWPAPLSMPRTQSSKPGRASPWGIAQRPRRVDAPY